MSRYLLLILINLPVIIAGITSAIVKYKTKKISQRKLIFRIVLWLAILATLCLAYPIYSFLFDSNLTVSEPLSLFDVLQISAIIYLLFWVFSLQHRIEKQEGRLHELHQELSIRLSKKSKK